MAKQQHLDLFKEYLLIWVIFCTKFMCLGRI
jgi:hypothetical protein